MAKNKSIPVEAYKCPKCDKIIFGNRQKAQEHVDIPVYRLPLGFTFFYNRLHDRSLSEHFEFHIATIISEEREIFKYPRDHGPFHWEYQDHGGIHGVLQPYISLQIVGNHMNDYDSIRRKGLLTVLEEELAESQDKKSLRGDFPNFDLAGCKYDEREGKWMWDYWINAREVIESVKKDEDDTLTMITRKEFEVYRKIFSGSRAKLKRHIREHEWASSKDIAAYKEIKGIRLRRTLLIR